MELFKKKIKPLNNTLLLKWRREALDKLRFKGRWSGYWETKIDGIRYRSEMRSGFLFIAEDHGNFIQDALIDRARLERDPEKYSEELAACRQGGRRYVDALGNVEQWHF